MSMLRPFWRFIEARPRPVAVLAEWRQRTGGAFGSVRRFISPDGRRAASYPNPEPGGEPLRVVRHRDGSIVAISPEESGRRLTLDESDLALFHLDLVALRRELCDAMGLVVSRAPIDGRLFYTPIGAWEPKPAAAFPAILIRATNPTDYGYRVRMIARDAKKPSLLLTSTRELWPEGLTEACAESMCLPVPLDEVIGCHEAQLVATEKWQAYLTAFTHYAKLTLPASFANKRPKRKRGERTAKIEAVRNELVRHIKAARKHAYFLIDSDRAPALLPRPAKTQLAELAGIKPYDLSRCFKDDAQLVQLWNIADDLELVMKYGG